MKYVHKSYLMVFKCGKTPVIPYISIKVKTILRNHKENSQEPKHMEMETLHHLNTHLDSEHAAAKTNVFTKKMHGMSVSYRKQPNANSTRKKWVVYKIVIDN